MSLLAHPAVPHVIKLLETTVGRDKLLRSIQYFSRFLTYFLFRKGYSAETIAIWKTLQTQLALSRKLFRAGKPISHVKLAANAFDNKNSDPVLRATTIARNIAYAGYLSTDTLIWLQSAKVLKFSKFNEIFRSSYKLWLAGIIFGIINSLRRYQIASAKEAALNSESEKDLGSIKKVVSEKNAASVQLLWDVLDSTIPLTALKWKVFDDGLVGAAGLITSILGLKQVWKATA